MGQCCGTNPTDDDIQHILDSIDKSIDEQIEFTKHEQEKHERAEREAEIELEQLHNKVTDEKTEALEKELQKQIDEERGKVIFWQTKTEQLECVGTHEKATFMRSIPQQNMKDENGEHTYYDPRNGRSGVAFADSPRRKDK